MDVQFRILGPVEVDLEGRRAPVPRGRALSLLTLLLVHRGAIVHLDRVADELWEGAGPQNPRNAVHVVASRLRGAVGEGIVVSEGGGYALRLWPGTLDADRFEERLRRGREELASGEPREAAETLRVALALWRGPALADVRDEGFAQPEIARLDGLRFACLSERVDADLACGRHGPLIGELEALVDEHPLRERFRGQLMLALYRAGRQADALAAYRSAHRALADGLGIGPSPELRALEAAILREDVPAPAALLEPSAQRTRLGADVRRRVTCVYSQLASPDEVAGLDPETLRAVLDRYHDAARAVCAHHGGTMAQLRSDGVLAVFGMPVSREDDVQRAVRAAAELSARTQHLPFGLLGRSGVCTGDVVAPATETETGLLIGDAVTGAERLARSAAGGEIRIAESTWQLVSHAAEALALRDGSFLLRELDDAAPAIARRLDRPLIGRDEELGRLHDAFAQVAAERSPELLAILGEPGIGKSRLLAELTETVGTLGTVLTGRCPPYSEGIAYWPLREIVLQVTGERPLDEVAAALRIPQPLMHRVARAVGLERGEAGQQARWAFSQLIDALARLRPVVMVVDDAQWAEPTLLDLLLDVSEQLHSAPVLIVLAARPDPFDDRLDWRRRIENATVLRLGPLSAGASATLLETITEGRLDAEQAIRIAAAAGGNPLFLEQLVEYLGEGPTDSLPPAIHAVLAARFDRLDTVARSVLALGAVAGDEFEPASVLALAAGIRETGVRQACTELVQRDLLVREGSSLRFRHALVRDVAYASLAKSARARLHEQHAAWLAGRESRLAEADARIGFHLEAACRYAQEIDGRVPAELSTHAGRRLAAAARVAYARGDIRGQIAFLERAIALLGTDGEEGVELLPALVSALVEAGSFDRADEVADLAVSASASLGLGGIHAHSTIQREYVRLWRDPGGFSVEDAAEVTTQATPALVRLGDERALANAAYLGCDLSRLRGDLGSAYASAERMLAHARRAGSGFDVAPALTYMGCCLVDGPCPVPEALARCDALAGEAADQRTAELSLLGCRAVLVAMTGDHDRAHESLSRARAGVAELGLGEIAVYLARLDAVAATLAGDPAAAEHALLDAEALVSRTGDRWSLSALYVDGAHAVLAQGRHADAAEAVARIETIPAPCDVEWVVKRHAARALVAIQAGDREHGLEEARAAVAAADPTGLVLLRADAYRTLAEALEATGERTEAATAARRALALDEAKGNAVAAAATRRRMAPLELLGSGSGRSSGSGRQYAGAGGPGARPSGSTPPGVPESTP